MSEREPTYLVLDENEDFSLTAYVDVAGKQRIVVTGYLERTKPDGVYRTSLVPELFFGADGQQLESWSQDLHAGEQVVLARAGGNPRVTDLAWIKVMPTQVPVVAAVQVVPERLAGTIPSIATIATEPFPWIYVVIPFSIVLGAFVFYKLAK